LDSEVIEKLEAAIHQSAQLKICQDLANRTKRDLETPGDTARPGAIHTLVTLGPTPIGGLLIAARRRGMQVTTLDLRSSGDTSGDKSQAVGYGSWLFLEQIETSTISGEARHNVYTSGTAKKFRGDMTMSETKIGTITHYFTHLHVAAVEIADGELHKGDLIHVKGHTSDFMQKVGSMEFDHRSANVAKPGDNVGIAVVEQAREHDSVYLVH
jgi:hypothetical protein